MVSASRKCRESVADNTTERKHEMKTIMNDAEKTGEIAEEGGYANVDEIRGNLRGFMPAITRATGLLSVEGEGGEKIRRALVQVALIGKRLFGTR